MKKSIVGFLHLIYWGPRFIETISIIIFFSHKSGVINPISFQRLNELLPGFICFYIFYFLLFPEFLAKKRIPQFLLYGLITWITITIFTLIVWAGLSNIRLNDKNLVFNISIIQSLTVAFGILLAGVMGCLFKGFVTWYSELRIKEELLQKNLQSELALLKAQINPHFLFNTINNIDVLIEKEPKTASKYLKQLSEMMRFMLYESSSDLIPLTTELEYIKKYIDLQKIRTANERYVNLTISGETDKLMIAPAIFIPFIENAFKHSTNKKIEDAINITIKIVWNNISFNCSNYFDNSKSFTQEKSGLGIDLIRQRLKLIYKDNHELDIIKTDDHFEVKLNIKT